MFSAAERARDDATMPATIERAAVCDTSNMHSIMLKPTRVESPFMRAKWRYVASSKMRACGVPT